ncbi:hypothetical protein SAMN05421776_105363 [Nocardia farcinica]|uniref:Uncharacterized protein n=1 Tax=Nocardia farcinica TaxID=37329 RepID=A0A0H5NUF2_NOCFR|nr:hypothetical protein [Nocardia farcinica]PFX04024.1 hypothetical protein CJ469_01898 [Nocardia farcinica]PFX10182.1 hypothetical protein CJ468_01029 [Nocardia farcinica]CRY73651.1 Uncharacterised protein [Nocardia farcinica]SIT24908.1 hypothetical protein SAMN05421776_105363 [Nocardia farcinica]
MTAPAPPTPTQRLEAVAAELDRTSLRGTYIPAKRLHELAEVLRSVMRDISP